MNIVIHPKARKALIIILILAVFAIVLLALHSVIFPRPLVTESGLAPDAQAAVNAATAFYTLDYTVSPELWISNLCALSTTEGCDAIRGFFAPAVQDRVQSLQIQTGCTVQPIRLVEDDGDIRIWQVSVTLDHPWPGLETATQDVFVEVANIHGMWLTNRILFEQEIERSMNSTP
jgi:hypothetical protein